MGRTGRRQEAEGHAQEEGGGRLRARRRLGALGALLLLGAACDDAGGGTPRTPFSPIDSDGTHLRDASGRAVVLRGLNARVQGVFDVTFDDGRVALEDIPALTPADCARMAELGFNLLRLPISWSGLEPERDQFDEAYLLAVDAAIECASSAGVLVLVDFHQDAYSKEIGEDGAPLWAIMPPPTMLLEGPLEDLGDRRTSQQVTDAFATFFAEGDPSGMQAEMIDAIAHVAARYKDHPGVVGIELYNEPQATFDELNAFQFAAAARVREVAPAKLVFFEPPVIRNIVDFSPLADAPFPVTGGVYAPHVYTFAFSDPGNHLATITKDELRGSNVNARDEAAAWNVPLFVGEFGLGPQTPTYQLYLGFQLDLQDETLASSAFWLWKEQSQGSWGLHEWDGTTWTERQGMVETMSRPYAPHIAGTPLEVTWAAPTLTVRYDDAVDAPTRIFVPERFTVGSVTCDGAAVTPAMDGRFADVTCGGAGEHVVIATLTAI